MILPVWDIAWICVGVCLVIVVASVLIPHKALSKSSRARRKALRRGRRG